MGGLWSGAICLGAIGLLTGAWPVCTASEPKTPKLAVTFGPYGPESPRLRERLWIVPGANANTPLRATVFRPEEVFETELTSRSLEDGVRRHPLVVINHGTDATTRQTVGMPIFYSLSKWFVERGYVVALPQRRGHGATGGELAEGKDTCSDPDHYGAGVAAADDIEAVVRYMAGQPFIEQSMIVVLGVSSGGWASLALAARNISGVRLVLNFAGGRGGHAYGEVGRICGQDRLISAAGAYGRATRTPTVWLYASNDSYFSPQIARLMSNAWTEHGGVAELKMLSAFTPEGHDFPDDLDGPQLWGDIVETALGKHVSPQNPRSASR